jgi:hypothetical protein
MKNLNDKTMVTYVGLINALIDIMENDFSKSVFNKQQIKFKTQNLLSEFKKIEDKLFPPGDHGEASTQYIDAGTIMLKFFKLGMEMTELDNHKQEGLNTQLNILFKNYGIKFE